MSKINKQDKVEYTMNRSEMSYYNTVQPYNTGFLNMQNIDVHCTLFI